MLSPSSGYWRVNKGLILCADVQIMHIMVHGYLF
ncbi:hypothetical protein AERO8C_120316 [Aeromonas veronii]|uniref:Uncharacterized protein n=1 Tax=Aeromonas veronii TaxID=654 RepID=A0A653KR22_AERVE|nr:hypothetical protein AERO8C_120316 [Aeromonas veronii]